MHPLSLMDGFGQAVLKSFDVAGGGIVHDGKGETEAQASGSLKFPEHHVESGIAGKPDHRRIRGGELSADGARKSVADGREPPVCDVATTSAVRVGGHDL